MKLLVENKKKLNENFFADYQPWYELFSELCSEIGDRLEAPFTLYLGLTDEDGQVIEELAIEGDEDGLQGY